MRAVKIGGKLRRLRQEQRLNQAQMATELGISPSYLNLLESNQRPVTVNILIRLAERFQVDLASLGGEDDEGGERQHAEQAVGGIDAFSEVRLIGSIDTSEIEAMARNMPEIKEVYTVSGDPDALIRFRVESVDHLQRVVNAIRTSGKVLGTKTFIVLRSSDPHAGRTG